MTDSYCLSNTSSLLYSMYTKCPPPARTQARMLKPLAISTDNNRVTQRRPLVADASFQFIEIHDLGMIDLLLLNVK